MTEAPGAPDVVESDVIAGGGTTVKVEPLLLVPPAVTTTGPVVAPTGIGTKIVPSLQLKGAAGVPLKMIVPVP